MEPNWEINNENMTRVLHGQHEVEEAVIFPVVVLQVLYNHQQPAVDKIH